MKTLFWISLALPFAAWANEIDYFNESIDHVGAHTDANAPAVVPTAEHSTSSSNKGWGQGVLDYLDKLVGGASKSNPPSTIPVAAPAALQPQNYDHLQAQLKLKKQEITQIRQQILQTQDGAYIQALTGTLHRLEAERQRILETLKLISTPTTLSPMAVPTPPVEKKPLPAVSSTPFYTDEEDALKAQLTILIQQEGAIQQKIKITADTNELSTLASQLERIQQNKSLVELSIQDVQRNKLKHSKVGFGAALLPPKTTPDVSMPIAPLTPSIQQVLPSNVMHAFPYSTNAPKVPAPSKVIQPMGTPITGDGWKKITAQAEASLDKHTHTTYHAPKRPLWIPKDELSSAINRKPISAQTPVDHRQIVEKIRKQKIF